MVFMRVFSAITIEICNLAFHLIPVLFAPKRIKPSIKLFSLYFTNYYFIVDKYNITILKLIHNYQKLIIFPKTFVIKRVRTTNYIKNLIKLVSSDTL